MTELAKDTGLPLLPDPSLLWVVRPHVLPKEQYGSTWWRGKFAEGDATHEVAIVKRTYKVRMRWGKPTQGPAVDTLVASKPILREERFEAKTTIKAPVTKKKSPNYQDVIDYISPASQAQEQVEAWGHGVVTRTNTQLKLGYSSFYPDSVYAVDNYVDEESIARTAQELLDELDAEAATKRERELANLRYKQAEEERQAKAASEASRRKQFEGEYPPKSLR